MTVTLLDVSNASYRTTRPRMLSVLNCLHGSDGASGICRRALP